MKIEVATIILHFITCIESYIEQNYPISNYSSRRLYYSNPKLLSPAPNPESEEPNHRDNKFLYTVGDDGIVRVVNTEEKPDPIMIAKYTNSINNYNYLLYTRQNPFTPQHLVYGEVQTVIDSNFVFSETTVVLVHGWYGHGRNAMNRMLTEALLADGNVNVIVFDWSEFAELRNYATVKGGSAAIGRNLGQFLKWLHHYGYAMYHRLHLIGHSLGGHIVGNAGRTTGGAVARITGLDPAGPLWYRDKERLKPTDGIYVEVIHTNIFQFGLTKGWTVGYSEPCGDADFYPNGGRRMPGCHIYELGCSHARSYELMASSIVHNRFYASQCNDLKQVRKDTCIGPKNLMGNSELYKSGRGLYRVNTKSTYPYI